MKNMSPTHILILAMACLVSGVALAFTTEATEVSTTLVAAAVGSLVWAQQKQKKAEEDK